MGQDDTADVTTPTDDTDIPLDTDGDGTLDATDTDDDNDSVLDTDDAFPLDADESVDTDSDGTGDHADTDDDDDTILDADDAFPLDVNESVDTDNDGTGDNADSDGEKNCRTANNEDQGKADLEKILDVPIFLKWLAANSVLQNWDTYGAMAHNYFLYRNPATLRFEWIPWDNNEALVPHARCLSLGASEVTAQWPLIRYLLDDPGYAAQYRLNVHDFASNVFNAARMQPVYDAQAALIQGAVLDEGFGYTFTSPAKFPAAISALKTHAASRQAAALAF